MKAFQRLVFATLVLAGTAAADEVEQFTEALFLCEGAALFINDVFVDRVTEAEVLEEITGPYPDLYVNGRYVGQIAGRGGPDVERYCGRAPDNTLPLGGWMLTWELIVSNCLVRESQGVVAVTAYTFKGGFE